VPVELEELDIEGTFQHEIGARVLFWFLWGDAGKTTEDAVGGTTNPEETEATWFIDDYWINEIDLIHAQITVDGKEVWEKKTIVYEVPDAGGLPTLEPKNYGVPVLGTKYGAHSTDEIPEELLKYTKEINGQLYTYSDSKLDIWLFENIYKPNHAKSFVED